MASNSMNLENSKGKIYYGLHFYPGVAEYREPDRDPYRVFINENTIRKMGPSFEGRPVYVMHVDDVPVDVNEMRKEADGFVIESFFNEADGKHWVKFLAVSDRAERAIKNGMKLSNCYIPKSFSNGGQWNGVDYSKEITDGEYEHLAIVPNPRYEESVILNPEQFKKYNEDKKIELIRLANDKNEGVKMSKFKFWERKKVENTIDIESLCVTLPKSNKELTVAQLINAADEIEATKDQPRLVNALDFVEIEGAKLTVGELVESFKNAAEKEKEKDCMENEEDDDDDAMENAEDEEEAKKKKEEAEEAEKKNKKKNAKTPHPNAEALRNAESKSMAKRKNSLSLPMDAVAKGKAKYGSK